MKFATPAQIEHAAAALQRGELVALPTETVYGLGADATNEAAIAKIFKAKGRPSNHPLIVHLASGVALESWGENVPFAATQLAAQFWPGPLTLILKKSTRIPDAVTGGQETVGLRCPAHPIAQALLIAFAKLGSGAIAAPSANKFGHVSPSMCAMNSVSRSDAQFHCWMAVPAMSASNRRFSIYRGRIWVVRRCCCAQARFHVSKFAT
jgi:L-threonylcarbamoyladenylate synthase